MTTRIAIILFAALAFACDPLPRHEAFHVGMLRETLLSEFGEPARVDTMRKSSEAVWGPIEDFWIAVPLGGDLEIWSYQSTAHLEQREASRTEGRTELYFVNGASAVSGLGFAPDGVVYEGQ